MKQISLMILILVSPALLNSQTSINSDEYNEFVQKQLTPLANADDEIFLLGGTAWIRLNGENEYVLSPLVQNIKEYKSRIHQADQPELGVHKFMMRFVNVEVNEISKALLEDINIYVPTYITDNVNVLLPVIDIEYLEANGINVALLDEYGKHPIKDENESLVNPRAIIWSEGWETTSLPSSSFSSYTGATNCGWDDVNCWSNNGNWSIWCAGSGAACNACGYDYVNDMDAELWNTSFIDISNYTNVVFSYSMDVDFNNTGTNDVLRRWTDVGAGWVLSVEYNSASSEDGALWVNKTAALTGSPNQFAFLFDFESNSVGTSYGAYLDDLVLSGNTTTGIKEIAEDKMKVYPNPSTDKVFIELNNNKEKIVAIELIDMVGNILLSESINSSDMNQKHELDLTSLASGVYSIVVTTDNSKTTRRLIID